MGTGAPVQAFTALGQITSEAPYQAAHAMDFNPFGVDVAYLAEIRPAPIRPLLERLDLTRGRTGNWGLLLRGPKRRVTPDDMRRIADAMGALPDDLRQIE